MESKEQSQSQSPASRPPTAGGSSRKPTSSQQQQQGKPKRFKKRVFLVSALMSLFLGYAIWSEGFLGLLALAKTLLLVYILWNVAWHLYLKKVPMVKTFANTVLNPYTEDGPPIKRSKRVVLDYGDEDDDGEGEEEALLQQQRSGSSPTAPLTASTLARHSKASTSSSSSAPPATAGTGVVNTPTTPQSPTRRVASKKED